MSDVFEVTPGMAVDISDEDNVRITGAAEVREFDVLDQSTTEKLAREGYDAKGVVGAKETIYDRARREGATVVETPLGQDPMSARPGKIDTKKIGSICDAICQTFQKYYEPMNARGVPLALIKMKVGTELKLLEIGFLPAYEGLFTLFTTPDIPADQREKMMQTIFLKYRLERGEMTGEQVNVAIGDLMGATPEKRKKVYDSFEKIREYEEKMNARHPARTG